MQIVNNMTILEGKDVREYPECEVGFSKYDRKTLKPIGLVTEKDCLHCREMVKAMAEFEKQSQIKLKTE